MDDTVLSDEGRGDPASEPCPELAKLTSVSLSLLHQNKLLGKAFHFPCKGGSIFQLATLTYLDHI